MKKFSLTDMLIFVVSAELTGAVSALLSGSFRPFYESVENPPLAPPALLFPVVWTILYALMGFGAYLIYRNEDAGSDRTLALGIYVIQLAVNFSWSIIFFRFRMFAAAALTAIALTILSGAMVWAFRKVSKLAAAINIPYVIWLIFASYLSVGVWILN